MSNSKQLEMNQNMLSLSENAMKEILDKLENSPFPNKRLRQAAKNYRTTVRQN